jgi:hypothetical protein
MSPTCNSFRVIGGQNAVIKDPLLSDKRNFHQLVKHCVYACCEISRPEMACGSTRPGYMGVDAQQGSVNLVSEGSDLSGSVLASNQGESGTCSGCRCTDTIGTMMPASNVAPEPAKQPESN